MLTWLSMSINCVYQLHFLPTQYKMMAKICSPNKPNRVTYKATTHHASQPFRWQRHGKQPPPTNPQPPTKTQPQSNAPNAQPIQGVDLVAMGLVGCGAGGIFVVFHHHPSTPLAIANRLATAKRAINQSPCCHSQQCQQRQQRQ